MEIVSTRDRGAWRVVRCVAIAYLLGIAPDTLWAADRANDKIETVTVTAEKRVENIQDVPISIVPLGSDVLGKTSAATTGTLQEYVPGLVINTSNGNLAASTYLRGDGKAQLTAGADPAVAYYEDEVYVAGKSGLQFDLLDIDRIEVLKGPQGTLFGRNSAAGAISITSKKPSDQFDLTSDTTFGSNLLFGERASVTGPIGSVGDGSLLYRVSVGYQRRDGFTKNIANDSAANVAANGGPLCVNCSRDVDSVDHLAGRGQLEWKNDSLTTLLSVEGQRLRDGMDPEIITTAAGTNLIPPFVPSPPAPLFTPLSYPLPAPWDCPGRSDYRQCFSDRGFQNQDLFGVTGRIDWTTGVGVLTSITAFRHNRYAGAQDNDGTDVPFLSSSFVEFDDQFSEELRMGNIEAPETRWHWIAGLYYLNTHIRQNGFLNINLSGLCQCNQTEDDFNIFGLHSYAAFGQLAYDITDRLTLTTGVRYTTDLKTDSRAFACNPSFLCSPPPDNSFTVSPRKTWGAFTPAVTLSYKLSPELMTYFSYRRGWISGGFQDLFPGSMAAAQTPFNPEDANSYTLGVKSTWFDDRLVVNVEAFRMDYTNLQVQQTTPGCGSFCIVTNNAGAATDNGADVSIAAVPMARLALSANMTIQDGTYTNYVTGLATYTGNPLVQTPKFSGAFSAQYDFLLPDDSSLLVRTEYNYRSKYAVHPADPTAPGTFQQAFGLLNIEVTYAPPSGPWQIELWAKNVTNTPYFTDLGLAQQTGGPAQESALGMLGEPFTFGGQLSVHLQ